jgi:hypothetical protein
MRQSGDIAQASPTKQFFVSMLTRDISLADAILDLVDNCLDGALRLADGQHVDYSKHIVKISLTSISFSIVDNCGGIPRDIAMNYAFKMGRDSDDKRDAESETIGMYGIGLKRAIFKMGRNAKVKTRNGSDTFEVPISSEWLNDKDWSPLPINEPADPSEILLEPGTSIYVQDLNEGVSRHFSNPAFINEVGIAISQHFTLFLQRGLRIEVNEQPISHVRIDVLVSQDANGPAPYVYRKVVDDVTVSIVVGLNTSRTSESDDLDDDDPHSSGIGNPMTAGWTVLCNDRAVIVGDKTRLTGWGDYPSIPLYHPQFSIITGIIEFRSKDATKLPVTTTKRALDTSSQIWLESLVKMKEGMRIWVTYTNDWKNHPRTDQKKYWQDAQPLSLSKAIEAVSSRDETKKTTVMSPAGRESLTIEFNPRKSDRLPKPDKKKPSSRRIIFSRPEEEIKKVATLLLDDPDAKPSAVGDACFDIQFANAIKTEIEGI